MTEADWIAIIALAEAVAVLALALAVIGLTTRRQRNRDHSAAHKLAEKVKGQEGDRISAIRQNLAEEFGLDEDDANDTAARIVAAEQSFWERLIKVYLRRDAQSLSRMDERLRMVSDAYRDLVPANTSTSDPDKSKPDAEFAAADADEDSDVDNATTHDDAGLTTLDDNGDEDDVTRLQHQVDAYAHEVSIYRNALNQLFSEYAAMFGVEIERDAGLTAAQVLERLESGALGGGKEQSDTESAGEDVDIEAELERAQQNKPPE